MGLTLTQLERIVGLTHAQARALVEVPFKAAGTAIKRLSVGRRVITYSFSDLAPRLTMRGIDPDIIAELAENGGAKLGHGSGGIILLRAA